MAFPHAGRPDRHLPGDVAERLPPEERRPTLGDLASHTAGFSRLPLPLYLKGRTGADPYARLTEDDVFDRLGPRTRRPHRRKVRYSNCGMGLLGHLLARAAGRPFGELMEARVLAPLGMAHTAVGGCGGHTVDVVGHRRGRPTPHWTFGALQGAGALRSTVTDLLRFVRAGIDPPAGVIGEALHLARRPLLSRRGPFADGGLGWMIRSMDRHRHRTAMAWHNGGTYGFSGFIAVDPDRSIGLVAVSNAGPRLVPPLDGPSWAAFDELGE